MFKKLFGFKKKKNEIDEKLKLKEEESKRVELERREELNIKNEELKIEKAKEQKLEEEIILNLKRLKKPSTFVDGFLISFSFQYFLVFS